MDEEKADTLQTSYDRVAGEYVKRIFDELEHKPFDRAILDRFAERVAGRGPVCDLGCGPGHVARYLAGRGVEVFGIDLSPQMIEQARRLNPRIEFRQADMRSLGNSDGTWAGIAAFYSLIHIPRAEVTEVLRGLKRVLQPGGLLLMAFHLGQETLHLDEWWGEEVCVDFVFFRSDEMEGYVKSAGLEVEETIEREPYADVEHPSRRGYIFASKQQSA